MYSCTSLSDYHELQIREKQLEAHRTEQELQLAESMRRGTGLVRKLGYDALGILKTELSDDYSYIIQLIESTNNEKLCKGTKIAQYRLARFFFNKAGYDFVEERDGVTRLHQFKRVDGVITSIYLQEGKKVITIIGSLDKLCDNILDKN